MPKGQFEEGNIQRSVSLNDITVNKADLKNDINRTQTHKPASGINFDIFEKNMTKVMVGSDNKAGDKTENKEKDELKEKKVVTTAALKEKAKRIKVLIPAKAVKTKADKALYKSQLENAKNEMRDLHRELEQEEKKVFKSDDVKDIKRKRYASLSASDIEKRAKEAVERSVNAQTIAKYEAAHKTRNRFEFSHIDKETLISKIQVFKALPSIPYEMDKDEDFIANLDSNYTLCDAAEVMKFWLEEATEGGFMPENVDMAELQEKIEFYAEVRKYLDAQKNLMKNPYYRYMAKEDISYNEEELNNILNKTKNQTLKSYVGDVLTIRKLHFVRSHGMKSGSSYAKERGQRAAEILTTKAEKREMVEKLTENYLKLSPEKRFADSNYDARFSKKAFDNSLKSFRALDIKDLHFADIPDIVNHFAENKLIFDRVHDFSHLLAVGLSRGMTIPDNELMELRAKIETLNSAEAMVTNINSRIIENPDVFINDSTYKELEAASGETIKAREKKAERYAPPTLGCDLEKYLSEVLKNIKKDHNDREKTIRVVYGLSHLVDAEDGEDEEKEPGSIPAKELEKRKANYQKNAALNNYACTNAEYIQNNHYAEIIAAIYARKTGREVIKLGGRTLTPYLAGKSAKEIMRVIDIMQLGNAKDKEDLWKEISDEAFKINLGDINSRNTGALFKNMAYRSRLEKIINNLSGSTAEAPKYIKDEDYLKKNDALYNAGLGYTYVTAYEQASASSKMRVVDFEDWFNIDGEAVTMYMEEFLEGKDEGMVTITADNKNYKLPYAQLKKLDDSLGRIYFMEDSSRSFAYPERKARKIDETPVISYYDNLRKAKYLNTLSTEDLKGMAGFYKNYSAEFQKKAEKRIDDIVNKIKEEDPAFKFTASNRLNVISYMAVLNKDKKEDELRKGVKLYKGLILDAGKKNKASRQERVESIEELLKTLMSFDIGRFNFKSYKDIIEAKTGDPERFEACRSVSLMAMDAVNYINEYKKLKPGKDIVCRLNDAHIEEVLARCDMLMSASQYFDVNFANILDYASRTDLGMPFDDILHLPAQLIEEKLGQAMAGRDADLINFWTNVKSITDSLEGFDIGTPLSKQENKFRFKRNLHGRSRVKETLNILSGKESALKNIKSGQIVFEYQADEAFKAEFAQAHKERELTISERYSKMANKRSRLYMKSKNSEGLGLKTRSVMDKMLRAKGAVSLQNRMALGEKDLDILKAFMTGKSENDNALAEQYADIKKREALLDKLTREIMQEDISIKKALSDDDLVKNADKLERISARAIAYKKLLEANPDYQDRLRNRAVGNRLSDLERVNNYLGHMLDISDYYRARKLLITDPYYVLHYNDEISANKETAKTEDQKRVSGLIKIVSLCAQRLAGADDRSRDDLDIDSVLENAEMLSRQNAYVTGRVDLSKADPDKVNQSNKEIRRYFAAVKPEKLADRGFEKLNDEKPYPEAEKYKTDTVKVYLGALKHHASLGDEKLKSRYFTPERKKLYDELKKMLVDRKGKVIGTVEFIDPVTKEEFRLNSGITRIINEIALYLGGDMSNEEIKDIFDGLLITYRNDIDLTKEDQRIYARERFLDSLAKIYRMEYENMKRYENTYGSLADELPYSVFMQSLGSGLEDFLNRNRFGQDIAQLCMKGAESKCLSEGEKLTTAELLLKYGKISGEMAEYPLRLGPDYYQPLTAQQNAYFFGIGQYHPDEEEQRMNAFDENLFYERDYVKNHYKIKGPGLSQGEERSIWKKAARYSDDNLMTGGSRILDLKKVKLDLYTTAQKKDIKKARKADETLSHFYNAYLDEREEVLMDKTRKALGGEISDALLKNIIIFHPGMLKSGQISKESGEADVKGTAEFYELVRKFAGRGLALDKKIEARKEVVETLAEKWENLFLAGGGAVKTINELMDGNNPAREARQNSDKIMESSLFYKGEVRHRMFMSIQAFGALEGFDYLLTEKSRKIIQKRCKSQLAQEIIRTIMTSDFYLNLKDVGSKNRSYSEKMYGELYQYKNKLFDGSLDLVKALSDKDFTDTLRSYGIKADGISVFFHSEEEGNKVEEKPEEKVETKTEEKVETKTEAKVEAKAEEKVEAKTEANAEEKVEAKTEAKAEEKVEAKAEEKVEAKAEETVQVKADQVHESEKAANEIKEEAVEQIQHYELDPIIYQENVKAPEKGLHTQYERQGDNTTYCWACVTSGLMNAYAGRKISDMSMIKKRPLKIPKFEESGIKSREIYDAGVTLIEGMYNGTEYGNPAIFGDYILDKLPDTAVRSAVISREEGRLPYCKRRFLETLSKNLEKGPVGMLRAGHFVLVQELRGDTLMVNNSLHDNPDLIEPYNDSVSDIFATSGQQVELVWLENTRGREREIADKFDINYDDNAGFTLKQEQPRGEQTILHRNGIESMVQLFDDVVFDSVYLPKKANG